MHAAIAAEKQISHVRFDDDPGVLPAIYDKSVNLAVWQRKTSATITEYATFLATNHQLLKVLIAGNLAQIRAELEQRLPEHNGREALLEDTLLVSDMFQELFGLQEIGFRLAVLTTAMCPRFHVDRVPCRMLTTYCGEATEWNPQHNVTRDETNRVNLIKDNYNEQLEEGYVALLKGEEWTCNQGNGIVHRSPIASKTAPRLVLTLDFI